MKYSYVIVDDSPNSVVKTQATASGFQDLHCVGVANTYDDALNLILEQQPDLIFLEINPEDTSSRLSLSLINELYRFLKRVPKIVVTTADKELAFEAIKFDVLDYCIKPVMASDLRKALLRMEMSLPPAASTLAPAAAAVITPMPEQAPAVADYPFIVDIPADDSGDAPGGPVIGTLVATEQEMPVTELIADEPLTASNPEEKPLIICVKSYGDYRFIEAREICYLQADNNSADIHLYNGEMITAFKTLKHFETVLSSPFVRIHNSYIVNIDYVSRIHTGNSVCYIKGTTTKLPFSKSYKENVDAIINSITNGNYLEI